MTSNEIEKAIAETKQQIARLDEERQRVAASVQAVIDECDEAIAPLDGEIARGLSDGSRHAEQVRSLRRELFARRGQAEQRLRVWDNNQGAQRAQLQANVNSLSSELVRARFEEANDDDLGKLERRARFELDKERDGLNIANAAAERARARQAEAQQAIDAEAAAIAELAELRGEREGIEGRAFADGAEADARELANLDQHIASAERELVGLRQKANAARAAMGTINGRIVQAQSDANAALDRQLHAERGVHLAVRNRTIRQIATLVDALREPLLTLEAADASLGFRFYRALSDHGLHTIRGDGTIERPDWMASPSYRPEGYDAELSALRQKLIAPADEI